MAALVPRDGANDALLSRTIGYLGSHGGIDAVTFDVTRFIHAKTLTDETETNIKYM